MGSNGAKGGERTNNLDLFAKVVSLWMQLPLTSTSGATGDLSLFTDPPVATSSTGLRVRTRAEEGSAWTRPSIKDQDELPTDSLPDNQKQYTFQTITTPEIPRDGKHIELHYDDCGSDTTILEEFDYEPPT